MICWCSDTMIRRYYGMVKRWLHDMTLWLETMNLPHLPYHDSMWDFFSLVALRCKPRVTHVTFNLSKRDVVPFHCIGNSTIWPKAKKHTCCQHAPIQVLTWQRTGIPPHATQTRKVGSSGAFLVIDLRSKANITPHMENGMHENFSRHKNLVCVSELKAIEIDRIRICAMENRSNSKKSPCRPLADEIVQWNLVQAHPEHRTVKQCQRNTNHSRCRRGGHGTRGAWK